MMTTSAKFWDRIAERYARKPVPDEAVYQRKLEITRSYFRPNMEVLELGRGTGSTAIAHASHVKHIRAVDISSRMLAIAAAKAAEARVDNVTFERATSDAREAPRNTSTSTPSRPRACTLQPSSLTPSARRGTDNASAPGFSATGVEARPLLHRENAPVRCSKGIV
jgi:SAM-dependent methyltransferase